MLGVSRRPDTRTDVRDPSPTPQPAVLFLAVGIAALYGAGIAYLGRPVPASGDGAAYLLQALDGQPLARSVHVGALAPFWVWVRALTGLGASPALAASLGSAAVMGAAGVVAERLARSLAGQRRASVATLLAPAVLLASQTAWQAALFVEVHGALALATACAVLALRSGSRGWAAAWAVALAIHPGALALLPGVLVLGGPVDHRRAAGAVAVSGMVLLLLAALPGWLHGERGILSAAAFDRSPWQSLQGAWRLVERDLGLAALPLLAGLISGDEGRRWGLGILTLAVGAALGLDRYTDNVGQLPALILAAPLAGLAPRALGQLAPGSRRPAALAAVALVALGIADATSLQDAHSRQLSREALALTGRCDDPPARPWALAMRARLLCRAP